MKILVLGANGRVGSLVVKELSNYSHEVRAFVHGNKNLPNYKNLEIYSGDIYDEESLKTALADVEIVISCLGSWGTKSKNILSQAMKNIIPLMNELDCQRIISLTGSEARLLQEKPNFLQRITHPLFSLLANKILLDAEEHLRLLQESSLDWTVIRSPVMNNLGKPSKFQLKYKYPSPFRTINRQSVAIALVNHIEDEAFIKKAPYIYRK